MSSLLQPRILVLVIGTLMLAGLGVVSWRFRPKPGARSLTALIGAATIWAIGSIYSLLSVSYGGNVLATYIAYLGASLLTIPWVFLALEYAGRESWVTKRNAAILLVVPLLTQLLAWTNSSHELLWRIDGLARVDGFLVLDLSYGPWFWVHTGYAYLLLVVGTGIFLRTLVNSQQIYRRQVALVLLAIAIPWAGNVVRVSGLYPFVTDPTPFLFIFSAGLFIVAFFRFRLLDLTPFARATVMDEMHDGVIVLDRDDYVVDVNHAAETMFGFDAEDVVGRHAEDVFYSRYVERYRDVQEESEKIVLDLPNSQRVINLRISPLRDRSGMLRGRVVLVRDITVEEEQRKRLEAQNEQLQRQNEHLDQFAGIVSHDLRNPLNVATGFLDLVREECESTYIERIDSAHDEMEVLIDDILTLAREGRTVGDVNDVSLERIIDGTHSADWSETTITVEAEDYTVQADPGRFKQLFENLFRNAVDHVGPDVTIHVGTLDDDEGFFVEDNGPGIPTDKRKSVFESGYTDSSSGTGLGLAIVESIVHAHGWSISITDGQMGGARFEIRTAD